MQCDKNISQFSYINTHHTHKSPHTDLLQENQPSSIWHCHSLSPGLWWKRDLLTSAVLLPIWTHMISSKITHLISHGRLAIYVVEPVLIKWFCLAFWWHIVEDDYNKLMWKLWEVEKKIKTKITGIQFQKPLRIPPWIWTHCWWIFN